MCLIGPTYPNHTHTTPAQPLSCVSVYTGSQSALEPDLQVQGTGAQGEDTQPTGPGAGVSGPPGGLQTQGPPERSVPQPPALRPQ